MSVAMIPARLGSKRVHNKNIRLIDGKPLISFIIETVIKSECFDLKDIYLNSESDVFRHIANNYGISFYKRPDHLSTDEYTNDDFSLDFLENVDTDVLYQFLPTSPFVTSQQVKDFVQKMEDEKLDTLVSLSENRIECVYDGNPINFDQKKKTPPSQSLDPIYSYACGLMAWRKNNFLDNMQKYGAGYHGGNPHGRYAPGQATAPARHAAQYAADDTGIARPDAVLRGCPTPVRGRGMRGGG